MSDRHPTVLLTRPEAQSRAVAERLRARIPDVTPIVVSPILDIVPVPFDLPVQPAFVILTSVHGAEAAGGVAALSGLSAWCVGDRTAEAARAAGLSAVSAGGSANDLLARLARDRPRGPGLHLRGRHAAVDVADALTSAGTDTHSVVAYDQVARPLSPEALACLDRPGHVVLPVYSPRSARLLAAATDGASAARDVVAISRQAAAAWPGPTAAIAAAPEASAMEDAIVACILSRATC